jgi:hypothetical protein
MLNNDMLAWHQSHAPSIHSTLCMQGCAARQTHVLNPIGGLRGVFCAIATPSSSVATSHHIRAMPLAKQQRQAEQDRSEILKF